MPNVTRHEHIEEKFCGMLAAAGLPQRDDLARMRRALVFLWYETKAFVLVELSDLPDGADALASLDLDALRDDVTGAPPLRGGFADAA
jgi:hypothetical protein